MVFTLIVLALVFFVALGLNWSSYDKWFNIIMITTFGTVMIAGLGCLLIRGATADEVDVKYPIYEVEGRYTHSGTWGEYNDPALIYYYKDSGGALRQGTLDAGSSGIRETNGDAYAFMTCPDDSTAWSIALFPWEDPEPNCEYEFVTLYVPQGES